MGTKIFQYCTCPAGPVTYNFHLSCKHMHLSFKSVCNIEHKGVTCNMTSRVILPKALVLQDKCFGKNYSSFLFSLLIKRGRVDFLAPEVPGQNWEKSINQSTSKLREINDIEHNKGSKRYPQNQVILDCILPSIPLKYKCLSIILIWVIVSYKE